MKLRAKRVFVLLTCILVLSLGTICHAAEPISYNNDLILADLRIGDTLDKAKGILGEFRLVRQQWSGAYGTNTYTWQNNRAEILEISGTIGFLRISTADYATTRGIRVGDSKDSMLQAYGSAKYHHQHSGQEFFTYRNLNDKKYGYQWLQFTVDSSSNTITKIALGFDE